MLPRDPSFYVRNASVTDPSLAPPGHSAVYVPVPVPNLTASTDWGREAEGFQNRVLDLLETRCRVGGAAVSHSPEGRVHPANLGEHDPEELYLAPTILADPPLNAPVMQEEIFGPVLPVLIFDDLEQVFTELRKRPTPLAAYLFTRDRSRQQLVLERLRSGGICINDTVLQVALPTLPFGGLGASGLGSYHGKAGFDTFSHHRSVLRRSFAWDLPFRYPPVRFGLNGLKRALRVLLRA